MMPLESSDKLGNKTFQDAIWVFARGRTTNFNKDSCFKCIFFNRIPILLDKLKRKHNKTAKLEIEDLNYRLTYLFSHNENKTL